MELISTEEKITRALLVSVDTGDYDAESSLAELFELAAEFQSCARDTCIYGKKYRKDNDGYDRSYQCSAVHPERESCDGYNQELKQDQIKHDAFAQQILYFFHTRTVALCDAVRPVKRKFARYYLNFRSALFLGFFGRGIAFFVFFLHFLFLCCFCCFLG